MFPRIIYIVVYIRTSFLFMAKQYSISGYAPFCVSYVSWLMFRLFCFLATVNNIAVNICVQGFMWVDVSISPGCASKSRSAGSSGNSVSYFEELPNSFFKTTAIAKMYESFHFSSSSSAFVIIYIFFILAILGYELWL